MPDNYGRKGLQKRPVGRCGLTSENTTAKYKAFVMENNITCTINCNYRLAATFCTPETWFD